MKDVTFKGIWPDALVAATLLGFTAWEWLALSGRFHGSIALNALGIVGLTVPLVLRRVAPLAAAAVMAGTLTAYSLLTTPPESAGLFVAILLMVYTVPSQVVGGRRATATVMLVFASIVFLLRDPATGSFASALPSILITSAAWAVGAAMRKRQERAEELLGRTVTLEMEKERDTRAAADAERSRIARELHDVIAHNLSTIVVQAGAARVNTAASPEERDGSIRAIEEAARTALSEVRSLLGLVRAVDGSPSLQPQPGLDQLESLCGKVRQGGIPVTLIVRGDPAQVPEGLQLSVYRIVQECLTNVMKHSGPSACAEVSVLMNGDAISVSVTDTGTGPLVSSNGGHGLVGIRERALLYGGEFDAGPGENGGFSVSVRLPIPASAGS